MEKAILFEGAVSDYIVIDVETPEIRPEIKESTNVLCVPRELGVGHSYK